MRACRGGFLFDIVHGRMDIIRTVGLILGVILLFNLMIFVHELGHFFAARWRGLYVDRFQIWFGKPLWKKKVNGVEWGIGWIPAGGFVSLPQMAPMESIEGESDLPKDLPPIKARDKIIVAFAGPLSSFLLAVLFACVVWGVGKTEIRDSGTTVGYVQPGSPAESAGILPGDKILAVDGAPVTEWAGNMEGVVERIMLGENPTVRFTIQRPGVETPLEIDSTYTIPEKSWWERRGMRKVGFLFAARSIVDGTLPGSPAEKAGLKKGDEIVALNGVKIWTPLTVIDEMQKGEPVTLTIQRGEEKPFDIVAKPELPLNAAEIEGIKPILGIAWGDGDAVKTVKEHPTPWEQIGRSLTWMKLTMEKIIAPGSDVGVQHLSGPVGIGTQFYNMLTMPEGWLLALWFAVILNVNLAVLNMLPLPVVDGGHVVMGVVEGIKGKPMNGRLLEWVQTAFAFTLMGFFLFVTMKDVGDLFGRKRNTVPDPVFIQKEK